MWVTPGPRCRWWVSWGPPLWVFLHISSINYSPDRKHGYTALMYAMRHMLPCGHCRNNFEKNYAMAEESMRREGHDDVYASRETYSKFVWYLHHHVNVMLGKDISNEPSFEQMRDQLETFRSRCVRVSRPIERTKETCTPKERWTPAQARHNVMP